MRTHLLPADMSSQPFVALHHHLVPCVNVVSNGLVVINGQCRVCSRIDNCEKIRTLPWFWAILEVFRRVPAAANIEVSRPGRKKYGADVSLRVSCLRTSGR